MENNIIKPLFLNTDFDFFKYERYCHNGYYFNPYKLCFPSRAAQEAAVFFENKLMPSLDELHANQSHYVFLSPLIPLPKVGIKHEKFITNIKLGASLGVYHRLCLVYNHPEYVEVFVFGLMKSIPNVFETFMNHINFLEKFCVYLREASKEIILQSDNQGIIFEPCVDAELFNSLNFKNSVHYQDFLKALKSTDYFIQGRKQKTSLSKREFECLYWCAKGKSSKEMGRVLSLSPRTVEDYINNIKIKLGCESKVELMDVAIQNPIIRSLLD